MCLAVPARLDEINGDTAVANLHGNRVRVCTVLTPDAEAGEWVLIHAGFSIRRLTAGEAERTWEVLADLQRRTGDNRGGNGVEGGQPQ